MERQEIMTKAAAWMQARGWKTKLAKRRGGEQSLFEHSVIELDVLLELLPISESPLDFGLNEAEKKVLAVTVLAHGIVEVDREARSKWLE